MSNVITFPQSQVNDYSSLGIKRISMNTNTYHKWVVANTGYSYAE